VEIGEGSDEGVRRMGICKGESVEMPELTRQ
jgi:hypothetical protein